MCERADAAPTWLPGPPAGPVLLAYAGDGCTPGLACLAYRASHMTWFE